MAQLFQEHTYRLVFRVSLLFKGVFSVLEIIGGIGAYFIEQTFLLHVVTTLTQEELTEDPNDWLAHMLMQSAQSLSLSGQHFAALYLLTHGLIKTYLIIGLLRERLWYYPAAIIAFGAFVVYQVFRFHVTHSLWLLVLTVVDIVVIVLTWHEYRFLRRRSPAVSHV